MTNELQKLDGELKRLLDQKIEDIKIKRNHAAWEANNLSYLLHEVQLEINNAIKAEDLPDDIGVWLLNCTRRIGKTRGALVYALERCLAKPRTTVYVAHPAQKHIQRIVRPELDKLLLDCPGHLKPSRTGGYMVIFKNGSSIELVGLDKQPDGLRGVGANVVIIDEAAQLKDLEYIKDNVIFPLLRNQEDAKCILLSTPNPKETENTFKDMCIEARNDPNINYFEFNVYKSPRETPESIRKIIKGFQKLGVLDGSKTVGFRTEYMCEFIIDENVRITPEWSEDYILPTEEYKQLQSEDHYKFWKKYSSCDPGYKDKTATLFGVYDTTNNQLVIEDEYITTIQEEPAHVMAPKIIEKETELWQHIGDVDVERVADNNNPEFLDALAYNGITFQGIKSKDQKITMVGELRELIAQGRVKVHERCKSLLGCLQSGIWDSTKATKQFAHSKNYGHFDALDALIYLTRVLDVETQVPKYYEHRNDKRVLYPEQLMGDADGEATFDDFDDDDEFNESEE